MEGTNHHVICVCRHPRFRQDHLQHRHPLGQVVVLKTWHSNQDEFVLGEVLKGQEDQEIVTGFQGKIKLIVVGHNRDCDGTPLYVLSVKPIGFPQLGYYDEQNHCMVYPDGRGGLDHDFRYRRWVSFFVTGIGEDNIEPTEEFIPLQHDSIYDYEEALRRDIDCLSERG